MIRLNFKLSQDLLTTTKSELIILLIFLIVRGYETLLNRGAFR